MIERPKLEPDGDGNPHPFADTRASTMLSSALRAHMVREAISMRQVARNLGMSAAVLSHMANGRVPIPVDHAITLADAFGIPRSAMVAAVLQQRFPDAIKEINLSAAVDGSDSQIQRLQFVLGKPLEDLTLEQQEVVREVVDSSSPQTRWLKVSEVPAVRLIRELRPEGISVQDYEAIRAVLQK